MSTVNDFTSFNLPAFLIQALHRSDKRIPTPIQAVTLPISLRGKDILASAETGSGKTLAYLLPLLAQLSETKNSSALILTPTRELAQQVQEAVSQLLEKNAPFTVALLIGGAPLFKQFRALKRGPRIIIGTPGRVNDHLSRGSLSLKEARFLVLDETDRMLDMGFVQALEKIAQHLSGDRQTFMFSATLSPNIEKLSQNYLRQPERISIGSVTQPCANVKQETIQTTHAAKFSHLMRELETREGSVIIFVKTKAGADKLADKLKENALKAYSIHGDLRQRRREQVIRHFKEERCRILVATDLAARGLDIPHVKHVINYDLPQCPEDYIHRVGRTGRAGHKGYAVTFISPDERWKWKAIHRLIFDNQFTSQAELFEGKKRRGSHIKSERNDTKKKKWRGAPRFEQQEGSAKRGYAEKRMGASTRSMRSSQSLQSKGATSAKSSGSQEGNRKRSVGWRKDKDTLGNARQWEGSDKPKRSSQWKSSKQKTSVQGNVVADFKRKRVHRHPHQLEFN